MSTHPRSGASSGDWPRWSLHAEEQFTDKRGDSRSHDEVASLAARVRVWRPNDDDPYSEADEVRYYRSGEMDDGVLLVIKRGTILTARPVSDTDFFPRHFDQCSGCGGVHEMVFGDECPYCTPTLRGLTEE
ncbi:hypothetical protein [Halorubrum salsamenti]|uniref:hypothetical protein n=1 Tax=Halorubrum salsamenti TaxID=2583990 RepID=UPI00119CA322|nr:hypothetical protein [Halorubrum salsamenti]